MLCVQDSVREENQFLQQQLKEKDELIVRLQTELVREPDGFNVTFHNCKFHNQVSRLQKQVLLLHFLWNTLISFVYLRVCVNILLVSCPDPLPRLVLGSYGDAARQFPLNWDDI